MIDTQGTRRPPADRPVWTSERVPGTNITYRRHGVGRRAMVFVHGFLDDQHVWDTTIAELTTPGIETVQLDLAGMGARHGAGRPFTYHRFAADVTAVVDALGKPFVIAGHSMGAPIAELVATARPERALGMVLLTPVPLAGTRRWDAGSSDSAQTSAFTGPVLIVRGADDGFITEDLVSAAVSPRFASVEIVAIDGAAHWPHLERPSVVAAQLDRFLTDTATDRRDDMARDVPAVAWADAFAQKSAGAFGEAMAEDVVLEASVMRHPIEGRDRVMRVLGIASEIYESVVFTHEASNGPRTYLEWDVTAFGGLGLSGVTVLTTGQDGRIVHAAIHHRPLGAALRFSQELRERAAGVLDPRHFYDPAGHT